MADISQVQVGSTTYDVHDATARNDVSNEYNRATAAEAALRDSVSHKVLWSGKSEFLTLTVPDLLKKGIIYVKVENCEGYIPIPTQPMSDVRFSIASDRYDSVLWQIGVGKLRVTISGDTLTLKPGWTIYSCKGINQSLYLQDSEPGKVLKVVC